MFGAIKHMECSRTSHYALAQVNPPRSETFFSSLLLYPPRTEPFFSSSTCSKFKRPVLFLWFGGEAREKQQRETHCKKFYSINVPLLNSFEFVGTYFVIRTMKTI